MPTPPLDITRLDNLARRASSLDSRVGAMTSYVPEAKSRHVGTSRSGAQLRTAGKTVRPSRRVTLSGPHVPVSDECDCEENEAFYDAFVEHIIAAEECVEFIEDPAEAARCHAAIAQAFATMLT